jgi:hypothetical protein
LKRILTQDSWPKKLIDKGGNRISKVVTLTCTCDALIGSYLYLNEIREILVVIGTYLSYLHFITSRYP